LQKITEDKTDLASVKKREPRNIESRSRGHSTGKSLQPDDAAAHPTKDEEERRAERAPVVASEASCRSGKKSKELEDIKKDILRSRRAVKVMTGEEAAMHRDDATLRDFVTPLERQRQR
jgi:hypothetical protein